jgi:hypothetical protein
MAPAKQTVEITNNLFIDTEEFFISQIGLNNGRSFYLKNVELLARLKYLQAGVNEIFRGGADSLAFLVEARRILETKCPFVSHGLQFGLRADELRLQVAQFLSATPGFINSWNKDIDPLHPIDAESVLNKVTSLRSLFVENPDCIVHPSSIIASVDLALLSGFLRDNRIENSVNALSLASVVRTSHRIIQALIGTTPDAASKCPRLLLNDNKDQKGRGIAAGYYAHVCSLGLPIFDSSLDELRTLLYFRCFEDQLPLFKRTSDVQLEIGQICGQWYDMRYDFFPNVPDCEATTTYATTARTSTAGAKRKGRGQIIGPLNFFLGVASKRVQVGMTSPVKGQQQSIEVGRVMPVIIAAQTLDLKTCSDELATIGNLVDEANKLEHSESTGEAVKVEAEGVGRKRRMTKAKQPEVVEKPSLLKNSAKEELKNAENQWETAIQKAQVLFGKSFLVVGSLLEQRPRAGVNLSGLDMTCASGLSHLFNMEFGINEKVPVLAEWLCNTCAICLVSAPGTA